MPKGQVPSLPLGGNRFARPPSGAAPTWRVTTTQHLAGQDALARRAVGFPENRGYALQA